jgi:hypothetical protein
VCNVSYKEPNEKMTEMIDEQLTGIIDEVDRVLCGWTWLVDGGVGRRCRPACKIVPIAITHYLWIGSKNIYHWCSMIQALLFSFTSVTRNERVAFGCDCKFKAHRGTQTNSTMSLTNNIFGAKKAA